MTHHAEAPNAETPLQGAELVAANRVAALLSGTAPLGVAFSGGVDSSTLLALAIRALGRGRVLAVLGVSPSLAAAERATAHRIAAFLGANLVEVATFECDRPEYRRNLPNRCFYCKDELFGRISDEVMSRHRLAAVAYGENADDARRSDRPGARAAVAHRVLRPLAEAGIDKAGVRRIARALALPCSEKPPAPCLASRIPHFHEVVPEKLAQIETAEAALHALGFTELRVRHHGDIARIELPVGELSRAAATPLREAVWRAVSSAGFRFVALDLAGVQSGAFTLPLVSHESTMVHAATWTSHTESNAVRTSSSCPPTAGQGRRPGR
ncbi:MAG: ATP-dependent sacrificial sulfur transferase LarE [Solirubrobacterales bacterium]|nr:ATP-dependent sacrificial sulfur transferase LarE [Solirubrobacterales bacterium]